MVLNKNIVPFREEAIAKMSMWKMRITVLI